jgi:hypothetical protein
MFLFTSSRCNKGKTIDLFQLCGVPSFLEFDPLGRGQINDEIQ